MNLSPPAAGEREPEAGENIMVCLEEPLKLCPESHLADQHRLSILFLLPGQTVHQQDGTSVAGQAQHPPLPGRVAAGQTGDLSEAGDQLSGLQAGEGRQQQQEPQPGQGSTGGCGGRVGGTAPTGLVSSPVSMCLTSQSMGWSSW